MLRECIQERNLSVYKLCEETGIPYSTLNDLVNQKVPISNVRAGILYRLSQALGICMDELYQICSNEITIPLESHHLSAIVYPRNKKYLLDFTYHGIQYTKVLCPVKKEATMFIQCIAQWEMEKIISAAEREEAYELYLKA